MSKHRRILLTSKQRDCLEKIIYMRDYTGSVVTKARILLMTDRSQGSMTRDAEIITLLGTSICTIVRTRRQFCENGLDAILGKKPRAPRKSKFNEEDIEYMMRSIINNPPPPQYKRWTIRLLARHMNGREDFESISPSMVYKLLQKFNIRLN